MIDLSNPMFDASVKQLSTMSCLTTSSVLDLKDRKPFDIEALEKMVAEMDAATPKEWMLISPQGVVTMGTDPLKLAAMSMPRPSLRYIDMPLYKPNLDCSA